VSDRLAEIERRLVRVTRKLQKTEVGSDAGTTGGYCMEDVLFIVNAPADITYLLSELKPKDAEIAHLKRMVCGLEESIANQQDNR